MGRFSRVEIEAALEHYRDTMHRAPADGDWSAWLDEVMTDDATFVGRRFPRYVLEGRETMRRELDPMMARPGLRDYGSFHITWWVIDEETGMVVLEIWNRAVDVGDGLVRENSVWSRLRYVGDGRFDYEEDFANRPEWDAYLESVEAARAAAGDAWPESMWKAARGG